jgi:hypothetical protein
VVVTATGKTITLPLCMGHRIGREWTISLATSGYVDIVRNGTATIRADGEQTTVRLDSDGASITLRCNSLTTWGIV